MIVEAAVEATGATGGVLVGRAARSSRSAIRDAGGERLELPLSAGQRDFGTLILVGDVFTSEDSG